MGREEAVHVELNAQAGCVGDGDFTFVHGPRLAEDGLGRDGLRIAIDYP
ncbi:hypothetical protein [Streptomyces sp. NPDC001275]